MVVHFDGIPICHIQFMPVMNGRWNILCEGKTRLLLRRQFPFEFVGKILLWCRHVRVMKKKCFSCAWNKEQASGVRVLSSAHCINELCKHQRTFDLQNASMKGVMSVYPASHVMGCSVVTSACVTHSYYGLSISWLPKWCGYHNHPFLDFSHCFKLTRVVSWFSHSLIHLKYIGLELMTIHLLT